MRVITGKYKGRHFEVPRTFKARPTTDFAKENLFNVLNGYLDWSEGPVALDLFSGTGSITLELISRGCSRVISVEKDPLHHRFIKSFVEQLGDTACPTWCSHAVCSVRAAFLFWSTARLKISLLIRRSLTIAPMAASTSPSSAFLPLRDPGPFVERLGESAHKEIREKGRPQSVVAV